MSDISHFLTTQIAPAGKPLQAGTLSSGTGILAPSSPLNFLDLILTKIAATAVTADTADKSDKNSKNPEITILKSGNATLRDNPEINPNEAADIEIDINGINPGEPQDSLTVYKGLPFTQYVAETTPKGNAVPADLNAIKAARVEKRLESLNKIIAHFTNGAPQDVQSHPTIQLFVQKLEAQTENLEARLDALQNGEETPFPALVALGLNPAQITKIIQRIQEVEEKLDREITVEDLIAGVANIIPLPSDETPVIISPAGQAKTPLTSSSPTPPQDAANQNAAGGTLEAKLNNLVIGAGSDEQTESPRQRLSNSIDLIEKLAGDAQAKDKAGQQSGQASKNGFSSFLNQNSQGGSVRPPHGWYQTFFNGAEWQPIDSIQSSSPLVSTGLQATHLTTQIQQAGQTHPATQLVAATLNKAAKNGDTRNMTLRLDPPELGRVDVRMEFSSDKGIKAHLVVEKPETYLMLQRDAAALERALQDSGLDSDSGSLSFELAEDGNAFEQNNNGKGDSNDNSNGTGNAENGEDETLETTMTWYVDPDSGHARYNILV